MPFSMFLVFFKITQQPKYVHFLMINLLFSHHIGENGVNVSLCHYYEAIDMILGEAMLKLVLRQKLC